MCTGDLRLSAVIRRCIAAALERSEDGLVRVEVPSTWPAAESIQSLEIAGKVRVGVMIPFRLADAETLSELPNFEVTDDAGQMTRWRDPDPSEVASVEATVLLGKATGTEEAGLRALDDSAVIRVAQVLEEWSSAVELAAQAEPLNQALSSVAGLLAHALHGVTPTDLDEYIAALPEGGDPNSARSAQRAELWRLHMFADEQLHNGAMDRRLHQNAGLTDLMRRSAPGDGIDKALRSKRWRAETPRALEHLTGTELEEALKRLDRTGESMLRYIEGRPPDKQVLEGLRLADALMIHRAPRRAPGRGTSPRRRVIDSITGALSELTPDARRAMLEQFGSELQERVDTCPPEQTLEFRAGPEQLLKGDRSATVSVTAYSVGRLVDNRGAPWVCPWTSGTLDEQAIFRQLEDRPACFSDIQGEKYTAGKLLAAIKEEWAEPVKRMLEARRKLSRWSAWLITAQLETLLLLSDAREAAREYLNAWRDLTAQLAGTDERDMELKHLTRIDFAFWGDFKSPDVVLGHLHPYLLLPSVELAEYAWANIDAPALGAQLDWVIDHGISPLAKVLPNVHADGGGMFYYQGGSPKKPGMTPLLSRYGPEPMDSSIAKADGGEGLVELYSALKNAHEYTRHGLRILLINPPSGKAMVKNLRKIMRDCHGLSVELALVGPDQQELVQDGAPATGGQPEDLQAAVKMLGRFPSIEQLLRAARPAHIAVYFKPRPRERIGQDGNIGPQGPLSFKVNTGPNPIHPEYSILVSYALAGSLHSRMLFTLAGSAADREEIESVEDGSSLRTEVKSLEEHAEWVGVASSSPLHVPLPPMSPQSLGTTHLGAFTIQTRYTDPAAVEPFLSALVEGGAFTLEPEDVLSRLQGRLLRVLRTGGQTLTEELALGHARRLTRRALEGIGYRVFEIDVDHLSWTRSWLASWDDDPEYRCDRIYVGIGDSGASEGRVCLVCMESKGGYLEAVMQADGEPWKKARHQVDRTFAAIATLLDQRVDGSSLIAEVRRRALVEQISAVVLQDIAVPATPAEAQSAERIYSTLNKLLGRELAAERVMVGNICVLTQADRHTGRAYDLLHDHSAEAAAGFTMVRCERQTLESGESESELAARLGAGMLGSLEDVDEAYAATAAEWVPLPEPPPSDDLDDGADGGGGVMPPGDSGDGLDGDTSPTDPPATVPPTEAEPEPVVSSPAQPDAPGGRHGLSIELGIDTRQQPVLWEPDRSDIRLTNGHMVILGSSGAGKTQALKSIMLGLHRQGVPTLTLDFKEDYVSGDFRASVGADLMDARDGLPVNPLAADPEPETGRIDLNERLYGLSGSLREIYGLGPQQEAHLRDSIKSAYRQEGLQMSQRQLAAGQRFPGFNDILPFLEELEDVALINRLSPIFDLGLFSRDEGTLGELLSKNMVVRLGKLPTEEVKKAAAEFLLLGVYSHLIASGHRQGTKLVVLIDEAHRIANLDATKRLLREARAFGCAVLLSSQVPADFEDEVYTNAGSILSLKLNDMSAAKAAARHVSPTEDRVPAIATSIRALETFHGALRNNHYPGPSWLRLHPFFEVIDS